MALCCCSLAGTKACLTCSNNNTLQDCGSSAFTQFYIKPYAGTRTIDTSTIVTEEDVKKIIKEELGKVAALLETNDEKKEGLSFGQAFEQVLKGKGMRLPSWKPDVIIKAQFPDKNSKMTHPYLYDESRYGKVPWRETFPELFSKEWMVVDPLNTQFKRLPGSFSNASTNTVVHNGDFPNTTYTN